MPNDKRKKLIGGVLTVAFLVVGSLWAVAAYSASQGSGEDSSDQAIANRQAAIDQHYSDLQKAGQSDPAPKPADPENAGPKTGLADPWDSGITDDPEFPGPGFSMTTEWSTSTDVSNMAVYAGERTDGSSGRAPARIKEQ